MICPYKDCILYGEKSGINDRLLCSHSAYHEINEQCTNKKDAPCPECECEMKIDPDKCSSFMKDCPNTKCNGYTCNHRKFEFIKAKEMTI